MASYNEEYKKINAFFMQGEEAMAEALVLSVDVGTQSTKMQLIDRHGDALATAVRRYAEPYRSPELYWAEQDGDFYYEQICAAARELKELQPELLERCECMVITVFRDSFLCLDKDRKPLYPCILWLDQRSVDNPPSLPLRWELAVRAFGMKDTADYLGRRGIPNYFRICKPELWEKTDKYVALSAYLNYRLCGELADSYASQIGRIPFDYRRHRWEKSGLLHSMFGIAPEKLCKLVPPGTQIGRITESCAAASGLPAGLPLLVTGSDKGCETLGMGVLEEDMAALSFGTCATVEISTRKYFEPIPFFPAYPAVAAGLYNGEIHFPRGYWMLRWFIDSFAQKEAQEAALLGCSPEELLDLRLRDIPAGCDGLMLLPQWAPSPSTPNAMGAMIGFHDSHTRFHMYRAIIEGLNFGLMDGLRRMERRSGQKIRSLRLSGGGSASDEICRITADMFGLSVERIQTAEATALGAAICAFVSRGVYGSYREAVAAMVHVRDRFVPDESRHGLYEQLYREVFTRYSATLSPLHRRLRRLLKL